MAKDYDYIGMRIRRFREMAGMTQAELAEAVHLARETISRIENGSHPVSKRSVLYAFAKALRVNITDLTGQPIEPRHQDELLIHSTARAVREALCGPDGWAMPRDVNQLQHLADRAAKARMAGDWAKLADCLPPLIAESEHYMETRPTTSIVNMASTTLVEGLMTASLALKPMGFVDLALLLAKRAEYVALAYAEGSSYEAAAKFALAQATMAAGSRERSLRIAERAIDSMRFGRTTTHDPDFTWPGMLHLHVAMCSASLGEPGRAEEHLRQAAELAERSTLEDAWHMEFTPANVALWRVGVALENGTPELAPELGMRIVPSSLRTSQRKARLYLDVARGLFAMEDWGGAAINLLRAEQVASTEVVLRPQAREMVAHMLRQGAEDARLLELGSRMGVLAVAE